MMKYLIGLVHGLHYIMGISLPPPEKEKLFVGLWIAFTVALALWIFGLIFLFGSLLNPGYGPATG